MQFKTKMIPLAGAIALVFAGAASAAEEQIVKIGHVGPISGNNAYIGKDSENGAKVAIDELNAKGVIIGGSKIKFELLGEDDAGDPRQGTAAAQKLVDAGVSGVIGHINSGTTIPASKIYFDAGIPEISPGATNPKYTHQGFKTAFRVVANDGQLGGTLGRYAVQISKAKRIAVVDDRTAYGQGIAEEFAKSVKSRAAGQAEIVAKEYTNDKATDFSAILTKIKSKNPDLIFFGGIVPVAAPMLRQMKQLGMNAKFVGGDGICTDELVKLAGDSILDGQVVCAEAGGVEENQRVGMDVFKATYKKKFGMDAQLYAPYSYDAVMVLVESMKKANSSDTAKYLPDLAKINYKGITGKIAFDANGDIKDGALTLFTYKNSKRVQLAITR